MKGSWILPVLLCLGLGGVIAPVAAADDKPVVAMIGTGTLASTFGPAVGRAGPDEAVAGVEHGHAVDKAANHPKGYCPPERTSRSRL